MKQKVVISSNGEVYHRLAKPSARMAFENGEKLYVMSIDRNPVDSVTSAFCYWIGSPSICGWFNGKAKISTFEDLLDDFSEWLDTDGYGHIPHRYYAKHYRFSYWIKEEKK